MNYDHLPAVARGVVTEQSTDVSMRDITPRGDIFLTLLRVQFWQIGPAKKSSRPRRHHSKAQAIVVNNPSLIK